MLITRKDLGCLQTDKKEVLHIGTQLIETSPDTYNRFQQNAADTPG